MSEIETLLWVWPLAVGFLAWLLYRLRGNSVGIPLAYLLGLALIHVPGAVIYVDPSYDFNDPSFVETGFQITTLGVVGFVVGVLIGGMRVGPLRRRGDVAAAGLSMTHATASEINHLAWLFLAAGFGVQYVIGPALKDLPLTALVSGLGQLTVAGACLGLYAGRVSGDRAMLLKWLVVACMFPFSTLVSSAFLGFGVFSLLVVVSFAVSLFRPRWWAVIPFFVALYVGMSIFVTYARDRDEYRAATWIVGGASLDDRVSRVFKMFTEFEMIDFGNPQHRRKIDDRLNQNVLVGAAEAHIASGRAEFARGETLWTALVAPIPRIIWPNKPIFGGSGNLVADYTGIVFDDTTSVGIGQPLEFFINAGWKGVFLCFVLFGAICRRFDMYAGQALQSGDFRRFMLFFLPATGLLQAGGAFAEVVATSVASFFAAVIAVTLAERYLRRIRTRARLSMPDLKG